MTLPPAPASASTSTAAPATSERVSLPHPEIFQALAPGVQLLLDDGKVRLEVESCEPGQARTRVVVGGPLSDRKGVSVVGAVLPLSALTPKDRTDLAYALELGADWIALSFVQRPEDVEEIRGIVAGRAGVISKLEKPSAIEHLDAIVALSDAVMVARGDLGVEMPPEQVPPIQRRIVRACRKAGKPSIVATQMLESMIQAPTPTRAEASDVASAIYHGADAVMLSAESAAGQFPLEAVAMMDRIITAAENDRGYYRPMTDAARPEPAATIPDAICAGMRQATGLLPVAAVVTYTSSGSSSLRASRERPAAPILSMAASMETARRLTLAWGVHSVQVPAIGTAGRDERLRLRDRAQGGLRHQGRHHRRRRRHPDRGLGHHEHAQDPERLDRREEGNDHDRNRRDRRPRDTGQPRQSNRRGGRDAGRRRDWAAPPCPPAPRRAPTKRSSCATATRRVTAARAS